MTPPVIRPKQRVAAYCRVSTDREDQANSLLGQKHFFASYIVAHPDWQLQEVYYDEGISGTQTRKRAGFHAMMESALRGELDLILTKEVSRFARNTVDALSCTRKLKAVGVGVIFTLDHIDTRDADGELRLTIMASLAQEESRKTSERVKWGQKRRMEAGVVFGRDLLGYEVSGGKLRIKEEEAELVRLMFQKYTNEGKGAFVIARELEEAGIRTKESKPWSHTAVLRILKNEKYVGDLCQKKTITPDYLTHEKKYNRGEEEMVYLLNHHEPIVDRSLWERTQEELSRRSKLSGDRAGAKYSSRYWCSGKIFCGECGSHYVSRSRKKTDGTIRCSWRCRQASQYGIQRPAEGKAGTGCSNTGVDDRVLLAAVKRCAEELSLDLERIKEELFSELDAEAEKEGKERVGEALTLQIRRVREKRKKLLDLFLDGMISGEELQEQKSWYEKKLDLLQQKKKEWEKNIREGKREDGQERESLIRRQKKAIEEILEWKGPNELLCRELVERVTVHRENRLEIWFCKLPYGFSVRFCTRGRKSFSVEIPELMRIEKENV